MISSNITKLIGEAMKAHDSVRLSTLRMLSSEFNYEKIRLQHELTESDEVNVIRKEAKKRKDAIEAYTNANAKDRAESEQKELQILQEFLPPELSKDEINKFVDDAILELNATTMQDLGKVISLVKSKASGIDGGIVAEIVKSKLV